MTVAIIILIIVTGLFFLIRKSKYDQDLKIQEFRLREMCDAYILRKINKNDFIDDDFLLRHVNHFIIELNQYSFYPETRNKAPYLFFHRLHELGYITMNHLVQIKEKYQNIILNLGRMMQQR